jgi:hypothetical protein
MERSNGNRARWFDRSNPQPASAHEAATVSATSDGRASKKRSLPQINGGISPSK